MIMSQAAELADQGKPAPPPESNRTGHRRNNGAENDRLGDPSSLNGTITRHSTCQRVAPIWRAASINVSRRC
jgi:hypothetical protein